MRTLRLKDSGLYVKYLQAALHRAGADAGEIDGYYGSRTARALRAFQSAAHLDADGVAGRLTRAALYPYLTGSTFTVLREGDDAQSVAERFSTDADAVHGEPRHRVDGG